MSVGMSFFVAALFLNVYHVLTLHGPTIQGSTKILSFFVSINVHAWPKNLAYNKMQPFENYFKVTINSDFNTVKLVLKLTKSLIRIP